MMLRLIWTGLMMIMVQVMGGSSASGVRTLSFDSNASCLALVSTNLMKGKVDAGFHVDVERQISRGIGEKSKSSSTSCHVLSVQ